MGHLPVNAPSPGLLSHPTAPSLAMDQLEGGKIIGMILETHKTAGLEQGEQGWLPSHRPKTRLSGTLSGLGPTAETGGGH